YKQRRRELLDRFDYEFHLRSTENETVLVCYPSAWMDNGIVDIEAIDDRDKAIERNLNSTHSEKDWETIYTINNEIATDVKESYGKIHGQTATAFSEFMSNHRMAPIWNATANDIIEFLQEYFVRNAWPTDAQSAVVNRSLRYTIEMAQERANSMDK
ncbi:MAG: rnhA operon protein, partial [Halobacteriaceae archaeon]